MSTIQYSGLSTLSVNGQTANGLRLTPQLSTFQIPVPQLKSPQMSLMPGALGKQQIQDIQKLSYSNKNDNSSSTRPSLGSSIAAQAVSQATDTLSNKITEGLGDSELGRNLGTLFSSGINSAGNNITNNIIKGNALTQGLTKDAGSSLAGTGAGLAANYVGQGINALGGNSMLSRGVGQGVATGLGTVGGLAASNLVKYGKLTGDLAKGTNLIGTVNNAGKAGKLFNLKSAAGQINPVGLAGSVIGTGLQAAFGSSKEYGGKYGSITKGMDTAYDGIQAAVGFIPGYGQAISGLMALNKGLSNIFGSTDGMTKQDAILGSAFMPAPVKWLNMAGATKTTTFNNQSWQNTEKTNSFMGNAFGNLSDKFDQARAEAGKTYGTFSHGAKNKAQDNINFANMAWEKVLAMADQNELQNIRSQYMSSINNQRYAQQMQGGFSPLAIGKMGMKILNNATNHNVGMRLLSGAALIDNKQMILSKCRDLD